MLVYRVENSYHNTYVVYERWTDALLDIEDGLTYEHDIQHKISVSIEEMTQDQFDSLPEFEGY